MGFEGYVDHAGGGIVRGWARDEASDTPIAVDLIVGDERIASTFADLFRNDLAGAGMGTGHHAFAHVVPQDILQRHGGKVRVVFGGTDRDLVGSPFEMAPRVQVGSSPHSAGERRTTLECGLIRAGANQILGWAYDPDFPEKRFTIRIVADRHDGPARDVATVTADAVGIVLSDGSRVDCGFLVRIPIESYVADVRAYIEPAGTPLTEVPVHLGPETRLEGFFDGIKRGLVTGWAWAGVLDYITPVDILVDGRHCGIALPAEHRPDLQASGVGHGNCSFSYELPDHLFDGATHEVAVLFRGTAMHLAGSPKSVVLRSTDHPERSFAAATIGSDGFVRGVAGAANAAKLRRSEIELWQDGTSVAMVPTKAAPVNDPFPSEYAVVEFAVPLPESARSSALSISLGVGENVVPVTPLDASLVEPEMHGEGLAAREAVALDGAADHAAPTDRVRFLVAIWGAAYIERFCEVGLPSLLAENNLPYLVSVFENFEFTFLTRAEDIPTIKSHAAYSTLETRFRTKFVLIDDIIDKYFKRSSGIYAVALSYAFLKGIADAGADATRTNFVFWNADFMASDGTLRTLTRSIQAGNVCTMAPSLRMNADVLSQIIRRRDNASSTLSITSQELVAMGLENPHPTVTAKTVNEDVSTTMSNINQFYWRLDENVLLARSFLMFMLHIRPEQVPEDLYSFCDYAFVPDMVVHGNVEYICQSDEAFIAELQEPEKESEFIVSGAPDIDSFAKIIDDTATIEHFSASQYLLVFNAGPPLALEDAAATEGARELAGTMSAVYDRLRKRRPWHAHHFHWRGSMRVLNADAAPGYEQGPYPFDYPRGETARLTRWTGYDLDYLPESWNGPPKALDDLYDEPPRLLGSAVGSMRDWLSSVFAGYREHWAGSSMPDADGLVSLVQPDFAVDFWELVYRFQFHGTHWGLVEEHDGEWWRQLGPDRHATLLLRTLPGRSIKLCLFGRSLEGADVADLVIRVNGRLPGGRVDQVFDDRFQVQVSVPPEVMDDAGGILEIKLSFAGPNGSGRLGFSQYRLVTDVPALPAAEPDRSWQIEQPTQQLLEAARAAAERGGMQVFDARNGAVGVGWARTIEPTAHRWIDGGEQLIVYMCPGDHTVRYRFSAELADLDFLSALAIQIVGMGNIPTEPFVEDGEFVLEGKVRSAVVEQCSGWFALSLAGGADRAPMQPFGRRLPLVRVEVEPARTNPVSERLQ